MKFFTIYLLILIGLFTAARQAEAQSDSRPSPRELGIVIGTLMQVCIGLLAFWFEEVMPFWWIIQKLVFVIGGMFIPIDFYPEWLQRIARVTPFAFASYWPASTFVAFSWERALTTLCGQAIYIVLLTGVALGIFRAAVRKLHIQGG